MNPHTLASLTKLSNEELILQVKHLAPQERQATVTLIAHLAELDARRLYLAEGCSSLFTYCTQVLHLSEHAAYGRIEAARAARRFPLILDLLADCAIALTTTAPGPGPAAASGDDGRSGRHLGQGVDAAPRAPRT